MKQWLSRLPIRGKLMWLAAVVSCVALLISGAVLVYYSQEIGNQALHHRLETQARIMALNSSAALAFEDEEAAKNTLMALAGDSAVLAAGIDRADGSSFVFHTFGEQDFETIQRRQDIVQVSAEVMLDERIGSVRIWAAASELRQLLLKVLGILVFAGTVSAAVALLAASRLQRFISGPILALAKTAEAVSRTRDYTLRVTPTTQDEVGKLVVAFNGMLAQTDAQGAELRAYQAQLEQKVEQRTTELARALKDAQAAAQAKADFLANMSHEIRTPMNGVIGMLDLMDEQALDPQRRSMLETARNSAESLLGIINDVLDFSKIDAGKLTLEQIDIDLVSLAEDVCTLFARQAHSKGVELTCLVEDNVPQLVRGDPLRLRQVLANLLGNAVKFTERGEVGVAVSAMPLAAERVALKIAIRDTGIGMAPRSIATLFNSFTQADSSTTRRFGGTGLGLAITKGLVDAMHGSVAVESAPGKGSTFTVTLPMQVGTPRARSRRADLSGFKVLIVDDNATNRLVLGHYLQALRVPHQMAASAEEGLAYAARAKQEAHPFDVVVLDYHMPDKDGVDFLRTLRADPSLASTKCIVLSSIGDRQAGTEALNIDAWLSKPVRQAQLYSALAMVTGVSSGWNATAMPALNESAASGIRADARILLVEDNVVNQQVATRMLAAFGIKANIALNGLEAVEYIKHNPFDLVFMDCQMPVMDGYQATEVVREWERVEGRARTPIVAMTANAMQGDRERCLAAGMDDYMAKPIKKDALTSVLARWLGGATPSQPAAAEAAGPYLVEDEAVDPAVFQHLRELFDGDVDEVIDSYLQDSTAQLAVIAQALQQEDIAALGRSAHSLKSSSRSVGALAVGKVAERLEAAARGGSTLEELRPICAELRSAHAVLDRRLGSLRAAPQRATG